VILCSAEHWEKRTLVLQIPDSYRGCAGSEEKNESKLKAWCGFAVYGADTMSYT